MATQPVAFCPLVVPARPCFVVVACGSRTYVVADNRKTFGLHSFLLLVPCVCWVLVMVTATETAL